MSDGVFLVPHMGIGQRTAQQSLDVTLSSSRPELLLAALHTPASLTGLFWLLRGRGQHQSDGLGTLTGVLSTKLEKPRWRTADEAPTMNL